jgi:hypothetical protein
MASSQSQPPVHRRTWDVLVRSQPELADVMRLVDEHNAAIDTQGEQSLCSYASFAELKRFRSDLYVSIVCTEDEHVLNASFSSQMPAVHLYRPDELRPRGYPHLDHGQYRADTVLWSCLGSSCLRADEVTELRPDRTARELRPPQGAVATAEATRIGNDVARECCDQLRSYQMHLITALDVVALVLVGISTRYELGPSPPPLVISRLLRDTLQAVIDMLGSAEAGKHAGSPLRRTLMEMVKRPPR